MSPPGGIEGGGVVWRNGRQPQRNGEQPQWTNENENENRHKNQQNQHHRQRVVGTSQQPRWSIENENHHRNPQNYHHQQRRGGTVMKSVVSGITNRTKTNVQLKKPPPQQHPRSSNTPQSLDEKIDCVQKIIGKIQGCLEQNAITEAKIQELVPDVSVIEDIEKVYEKYQMVEFTIRVPRYVLFSVRWEVVKPTEKTELLVEHLTARNGHEIDTMKRYIRPGDILLSMNSTEFAGMTCDRATKAIIAERKRSDFASVCLLRPHPKVAKDLIDQYIFVIKRQKKYRTDLENVKRSALDYRKKLIDNQEILQQLLHERDEREKKREQERKRVADGTATSSSPGQRHPRPSHPRHHLSNPPPSSRAEMSEEMIPGGMTAVVEQTPQRPIFLERMVHNNGKRKRGEDGGGHDENDRDGDGNNNNNSDAKPDAVVSLQEELDDDDIDLYVAYGEIPTLAQLGRFLTMLESVPVGKFDDRTIQCLKVLSFWTDECYVGEEKSNQFKMKMIDLGGLMRMICLIERHMADAKVVQIVSRIFFGLTTTTGTHPTDMIMIENIISRALHLGATWTLILASEEVIPADKEENWVTASSIWSCVCSLCIPGRIHYIDFNILVPIIESNPVQQCLVDPTQFNRAKLLVATTFATALHFLLLAHSVTAFNTVRANSAMISCQEFCCRHMHQIIDDATCCWNFLGLFNVWELVRIEFTDDKSSACMKKMLPFVSKALSVHHTHLFIEERAFFYIERAIQNIDRRELVCTSLKDDLLVVIRSDDVPEHTKTKYSDLVKMIS